MALSGTSGFTGNDIVTRVQNFVGNNSTKFKTYVEQSLDLALFRFCKAHDWNFMHKSDLSLAVTNGTAEYDLSVANIGHYMAAENVETIFDESNGIVAKRVDLNQIRRLDPADDDGSDQDGVTLWAPVADNKIRIWPPNVKTGTVKIDGKISPVSLSTNLANFPDIPYRYQEGFIELVIAMALERENDDRAPGQFSKAIAIIREDIKDDLRQLSNTENPRIKSMREARHDGIGANIDAFLLGFLDYYYDSEFY